MNDELKGIFLQRNTCYVVRIRRKGVNPYSRTFYFEHDKDGIKKSEALQDAIAWRQQELASVARDGVRVSRNANLKTLKVVMEEYKAEKLTTDKEKGLVAIKGATQALHIYKTLVTLTKKIGIYEKPCLEITKEDFLRLRDLIKGEGTDTLANATVNRHFSNLGAMYKHQRTAKRVEIYLPKEMNLPVNDAGIPTTTDEDTFEKIVAYVNSPITQDAMRILFYTGARRSEICNLKFENIDFNGGLIVLPTSKNDKPRTIFLNSTCIEILSRLNEKKGKNGDFVFSSTKGEKPFFPTTFSTAWIRARARLAEETENPAIKIINLHALRHSFITKMATKVNTLVLKKFSGHRSIVSLERYEHAAAQIIKDEFGHLLEKAPEKAPK